MCRLGTAANGLYSELISPLFRSICRLETVSARPIAASRGGAVGKETKTASAIALAMNSVVRIRA